MNIKLEVYDRIEGTLRKNMEIHMIGLRTDLIGK